MMGVGGVTDDAKALGQAALSGSYLDGRGTGPFLCRPHHPLKTLPVRSTACSCPHRDAAGQDAFDNEALTCHVVNEKRCMVRLVLPEVDNDLLVSSAFRTR